MSLSYQVQVHGSGWGQCWGVVMGGAPSLFPMKETQKEHVTTRQVLGPVRLWVEGGQVPGGAGLVGVCGMGQGPGSRGPGQLT